MTEVLVTTDSEATISAVVLRAVPCEKHEAYEADCPNCLTGEEARERGVPQKVEDKGVVSRGWFKWR